MQTANNALLIMRLLRIGGVKMDTKAVLMEAYGKELEAIERSRGDIEANGIYNYAYAMGAAMAYNNAMLNLGLITENEYERMVP